MRGWRMVGGEGVGVLIEVVTECHVKLPCAETWHSTSLR